MLTPHEGEFPRLFSDISNKHPQSLEARAGARRRRALRRRRAAEGAGHRGGRRRTAAPPSPPTRRPGLPPPAPATCWPASSLGCWRKACRRSRPPASASGCTARRRARPGPGLIAEDLPEVLPAVFRRLYDEFGIEYLSDDFLISTLYHRTSRGAAQSVAIGFHQPAARHSSRRKRCAGSGRGRSPACPARTASSHRRAGRAGGNGGRAGGRRWRSRRGWSAPAPRCGRSWRGSAGAAEAAKLAGVDPAAWPGRRAQIEPQGAFEVESAPAGRWRAAAAPAAAARAAAAIRLRPRACRSGGPPCRHAAGSATPCRGAGIDKGVGAAAGRQHQGAVAGRERFGRLAVERHDADFVVFNFDCHNSALAAIDEAKPQAFIGAG